MNIRLESIYGYLITLLLIVINNFNRICSKPKMKMKKYKNNKIITKNNKNNY